MTLQSKMPEGSDGGFPTPCFRTFSNQPWAEEGEEGSAVVSNRF